jgi:zinc protease
LFIYDLGLDYYTKFPARLARVTADDVRSVAQKYVVPDRLLVVAAGDRTKIEPELSKLNLGPVEVRTPEGMLAPSAAGAK